MRNTRRRQRRPDPLASPAAVRAVLSSLKSSLPNDIPAQEKKQIALLRAARHVQRYSATDTKRGRPGKFGRELLIKVAARTSQILQRETSSKVGFASFADHYLRLLEFPADVLAPLSSGDINLFEAAQLARLTPARLRADPAQAKRTRGELLKSHLAARASSTRLRLRVNELLAPASGQDVSGGGFDELDLLDEFDPTHLFFDQVKQLVIDLREIQPGDLEESDVDELLEGIEPVLSVLARVKRRKAKRVIKPEI